MKLLKRILLIDIPPQNNINEELYMHHTGSVIVNSHAKIGENVTLSSGITIRKTINKITGEDEHPTNAIIVGGLTIGYNVLVAANTFITENVPSNSIVLKIQQLRNKIKRI